jgi:uncharacterized membrane protein (DUF2068 family)
MASETKMETKPKIQRWDTTLISIFYIISGIMYFIILGLDMRNLVAILLGLLSIIVAYGLFKTKTWTIPFAAALFFPQITFELFALYASMTTATSGPMTSALLFNIGLIVHVVILTICLLYVVTKRKEFQI